MQCIEQASSCPQCENGYGWKLGKKKVRNCRQYKEGGRPTRVMGGEGGEGGGIQNLKSSINIIPEMYTLEEAEREREREREREVVQVCTCNDTI
jgi:hypothetical protein